MCEMRCEEVKEKVTICELSMLNHI
jgi:hypothetical protein